MQLVGAIQTANHRSLGQDAGEIAGVGHLGVTVSNDLPAIIDKCDVVLEFTTPAATLEHLQNVVDAGKAMIIGTTGFTVEELEKIHELASQIRCVMAPNFSVGINLLLKIISDVARVFGDDYDIEVIEAHHNKKVDSPSGTAKQIAKITAETLQRDFDEVGIYIRNGILGARAKDEIGVHAIRGGDIASDHTISFAGICERLEITHRARSCETYAQGALRAARWVVDAPKGLHDVSEVLFGN